jgi:hypothetical protein
MIRKGNERKQEQCESAQIHTRDSQDHIAPIIASLSSRIEKKLLKVRELEDKLKQSELEFKGLSTAQEALKAKMIKREGQIHQSESEIKKSRDNLRSHFKNISPKTVKSLT